MDTLNVKSHSRQLKVLNLSLLSIDFQFQIVLISMSALDANVEELSSGKQVQVSHWRTTEMLQYPC